VVIDEAPERLRDIKPRLWSVAFSADGKTLAVTGGWDQPEEPGELVVWDLESRSQKLVKRQEKTIRRAVFSPDGKSLAICDFAGNVRLLDLSTGKIMQSLPERPKLVNSVAFTSDSKTLVAGGFNGTITIWDAAVGKEKETLTLPDEMITTVAISSDDKYLAAITWQGKAYVWDLPQLKKRHVLTADLGQGQPGIGEAVAFSRDAKSFVTGCWDKTLKIWNTGDGKLVRELEGHATAIQNAIYSPTASQLVTSDAKGTVIVWNAENGERIDTLDAHQDRCFGLAFSPDGKRLATAGWDRVVKVWDTKTWKVDMTLPGEK
jgi:WD40 repeat protein